MLERGVKSSLLLAYLLSRPVQRTAQHRVISLKCSLHDIASFLGFPFRWQTGLEDPCEFYCQELQSAALHLTSIEYSHYKDRFFFCLLRYNSFINQIYLSCFLWNLSSRRHQAPRDSKALLGNLGFLRSSRHFSQECIYGRYPDTFFRENVSPLGKICPLSYVLCQQLFESWCVQIPFRQQNEIFRDMGNWCWNCCHCICHKNGHTSLFTIWRADAVAMLQVRHKVTGKNKKCSFPSKRELSLRACFKCEVIRLIPTDFCITHVIF